jgi:hypothetical protein
MINNQIGRIKSYGRVCFYEDAWAIGGSELEDIKIRIEIISKTIL